MARRRAAHDRRTESKPKHDLHLIQLRRPAHRHATEQHTGNLQRRLEIDDPSEAAKWSVDLFEVLRIVKNATSPTTDPVHWNRDARRSTKPFQSDLSLS